MFPLKQKKIGGYEFGEKTFYSDHHLGTDYTASTGTPLYAPFTGVITKVMTGTEGGKTIWFKPDKDNVIMRFMHLSEFKRNNGTMVEEGDVIGLTGNTGSMTKAPHLHLDISKSYVKLNDFNNFIDPEKYEWEKKVEIPQPVVVEPPIEPQPVVFETHPIETVEKGIWQDVIDELLKLIGKFFNSLKI